MHSTTNEFLAEITDAAAQAGKLLVVVRSDDEYRARREEIFQTFVARKPVVLVTVGRVPAAKLCPLGEVNFLTGEGAMLPSDLRSAERLRAWVGC